MLKHLNPEVVADYDDYNDEEQKSMKSGERSTQVDTVALMRQSGTQKIGNIGRLSSTLDDVDEEDCNYLLRVLEQDAFSAVVSAFRAQGMLTGYKETLLKHLKSCLFISDSIYHAGLRQAGSDESLSKIASTLNPSYDTNTQWECAGQDPVLRNMSNIPLYDSADMKGSEDADKLLRLANDHNSAIDDQSVAICELIGLPETPYVPERLRLLLRDTEKDFNDRINIGEMSSSLFDAMNEVTKPVQKLDAYKEDHLTSNLSSTQKSSDHADSSISSPLKGVAIVQAECSSAKNLALRFFSTEKQNVSDLKMSLSNSSQSTSMFTISSSTSNTNSDAVVLATPNQLSQSGDEGDRNTVVELTTSRKRKLRQPDPSVLTCARIRPFIFESITRGQKSKPMRGNPDRRSSKHTPVATTSCTASSISVSNAAVAKSLSLSPHSTSVMSNSYNLPSTSQALPLSGKVSTTTTVYALAPGTNVAVKRSRTTSSSTDIRSVSDSCSIPLHTTGGIQPSMIRIQQPSTLGRTFLRAAYPARYFTSPIGSGFNNPSRPNYGNPSAGTAGILRSFGTSNYTISNTPTAYGPHARIISSSEIDRVLPQSSSLVSQAVMGGSPYRAIRRMSTLTRPVYLSTTCNASHVRPSVSNYNPALSAAQSSGQSVIATGVAAEVLKATATPSVSGMSSYTEPIFRLASFSTLPSHSRIHSIFTHGSNIRGHNYTARLNAGRSPLLLPGKTLDSFDSFNSDEVVEQERSARGKEPESETLPIQISDQTDGGVRLECDEVMIPEYRYSQPTSLSDPGSSRIIKNSIQTSRLQQRKASGISVLMDCSGQNTDGTNDRRILPSDYENGIMRRDDGQNVINYVAAPQCIR